MAQYARPSSDQGSSISWDGNDSGIVDLYTYIDETTANDSTDYIRSQADQTGYYETGLSSVTDPASNSGHIIRARVAQTGGLARQVQFQIHLYEGTTKRASSSTFDTDEGGAWGEGIGGGSGPSSFVGTSMGDTGEVGEGGAGRGGALGVFGFWPGRRAVGRMPPLAVGASRGGG